MFDILHNALQYLPSVTVPDDINLKEKKRDDLAVCLKYDYPELFFTRITNISYSFSGGRSTISVLIREELPIDE